MSSPTSSSYGVSATTDRLLSAVDSGGNDSLLHGNGMSLRQSQTLPRRCMTPSWDTNGKMTSSTDGNHLPLVSEQLIQNIAVLIVVTLSHDIAFDIFVTLS